MTADADAEVKLDITSTGATFRSYRVERNAVNPLADFATLLDLRRAYRELDPCGVLAYTIKPVIWGAIAGRGQRSMKFCAMITGLGYAFQGESWKRKILSYLIVRLYRYALKRADSVIFQNTDNKELFIRLRIVPKQKCHVVNGSGVDLSEYLQRPLPAGPPKFLLIARLLGEKGIREYARAAQQVRREHPDAEFFLVGPTDPSLDGIPLSEIEAWHQTGNITYMGATKDVRPHIENCHVYVLPSYHEGMPRTVLEAMAMGRPILTTDVCGCRETVEPGNNGWLVPHADTESLVARMLWFIEHREQWQSMGNASRQRAEQKFDVDKVNEHILRILGF